MTDSIIEPNNRILIIDDNRAIHDDIRSVLSDAPDTSELDSITALMLGRSEPEPTDAVRRDYHIESAFQGEQGLELLTDAFEKGSPFAIAFVDMRMPPGWDGVETIEHLWRVDPDLEVVICTAYSDYSFDEISNRLGNAHQLLILRKPFDNAEVRQLACALTEKWRLNKQSQLNVEMLSGMVDERTKELEDVAAKLRQEIHEREIIEQQLRHDAFHDCLTGLPNRSALNHHLQQSIRRSKRDTDHKYAVLFIDIDNFKVVNDSMGHTKGDDLLIDIGRRLTSVLRDIDVAAMPSPESAARLGGDEFVVLLEELSAIQDAVIVANRCLEALAPAFDIDGIDFSVSASVGIATSEFGYETADEVFRDADTALCEAKASGKSCVIVFDQEMRERAIQRMELESDLRRAIEENQFVLMFQPIISIASKTVTGFEALIRWHHPQKGIIPPFNFIPLAEETRLISKISEWVMKEACAKLASWREHDPRANDLTVSVNLSSQEFGQTNLPDTVNTIVGQSGLSPDSLRIEITESLLMQDLESVSEVLYRLKSSGIQLYMDDFGTGYSSLSYLHKIPIDVVKIDRSFVSRLGVEEKDTATVEAIITLAHNQGMKVVAEGVETESHLEKLKGLNCDFAQGYYFARPLDASDVEPFVAEWSG